MDVEHQKQRFLWVIEHFITNNEKYKEILVICEECKQKFILCRAYID